MGFFTMRFYILIEHAPVPVNSLLSWARWMETADRQVAYDELGDVDVSTVFLGLDHGFDGNPPILFETMVFGGPLHGECDRYATWDDAEAGHTAMLARVAEALEHARQETNG